MVKVAATSATEAAVVTTVGGDRHEPLGRLVRPVGSTERVFFWTALTRSDARAAGGPFSSLFTTRMGAEDEFGSPSTGPLLWSRTTRR